MKHPNFYRCEISAEHCDFFTIASGNCYLGRYSYWDSGTVIDESIPMTYHKSGMYIHFFKRIFKIILDNSIINNNWHLLHKIKFKL